LRGKPICQERGRSVDRENFQGTIADVFLHIRRIHHMPSVQELPSPVRIAHPRACAQGLSSKLSSIRRSLQSRAGLIQSKSSPSLASRSLASSRDPSYRSEEKRSSMSGSETPVTGIAVESCLSESATPVNDIDSLDPDQLTLRLHLYAALAGRRGVPRWDGLAEALRVYFSTSWQKDEYTLHQCESQKEFLFWNAVAEEKWRASAKGY
jgi:hypothetical protein